MGRITLVKYEEQYRDDLHSMLIEFSNEVFTDGTANLDYFVDYHWAIYLAIKDGKAIGFTSFIYNTYYGLRTPTVGNDYVYVQPHHRGGKCMFLFSLQAGVMCLENNIPLEAYFATDDGNRLSKAMKGDIMFTAHIYGVDEVSRKFKKLTNKYEIKQ